MTAEQTPKDRLEYFRDQIEAECISTGEIVELQSMVEHIEPGDVLLLEWAGVPEFPTGHTPNMVLQIIFAALRDADNPQINDVTMDTGVDKQCQIILTTDGDEKQVWVLDAQSLVETDPPN